MKNMTDIGNCKDKRILLQDIDKDFDIAFCTGSEQYIVTHKRFPFQQIPWDGFNREVVDHIRYVVYLNKNRNITEEIDNNNAKVDKDRDSKFGDMAREFAKDIRKPLIRDYAY